MARRKQAVVAPSHFVTEPYMEINGFPIQQGDIIKVHNEWGVKFKFVGMMDVPPAAVPVTLQTFQATA